jgi:predicted phage terminase large subunit-like protein
MNREEIDNYTEVIIPNIERELMNENLLDNEKLEIYNLYHDVLRAVAPYNFIVYNMYLELEEDKTLDSKGFYHHRKEHMGELFQTLDDMESKDMYDILIVTMPPRTGKTTSGIRFLSWIMGKYPEYTQLATSYSDSITTSFYIGTMEVVQSQAFKDIFPDAPLVNQNGKREEIWLKVFKRYPTITYVPIGGSMTGRAECSKYLYCDDLVSGIEEALSVTRLEKLVQTYNVNCKQRKKDGCKEIHVATPWSVHDVIANVTGMNEGNPRCKVIAMPCYDEKGESQFDFVGGFSTAYYDDMKKSMDSASFSALYLQEPIEREGLLYHPDDMKYYMSLPNEAPDTIVAICDSKNLGNDYVASPVGYIYGDDVYIVDVVYNNGLPEITRPLVANKWLEHKVVRADIELNNGGNYYAEDLDKLIKDEGGKTSIKIFYSGNNKLTKIITYSDFVKKNFIFKDISTYSPHSEYAKFMKDMFSFTQMGKNKHDDSVDSIAMLGQMVQEIGGNTIKFLDRRRLGL